MTKSTTTIRPAGEDNIRHRADLGLLTLLLAKCLREDHLIHEAPKLEDISILGDTGHSYGHDELRVTLDVGRGLCFQISQFWRKDGLHDGASLLEMAAEIADAIGNLKREATSVRSMIAAIRAAARREVSKGIRRGLRYKLLSVEPTPYYIGRSTGVGAEVRFEYLGRSLQPEIVTFDVDYTDELKEKFAAEYDVQTRRAQRRAALDAIGATGVIDSVVVNALRASGADIDAVLAQLGDMEGAHLDLDAGGTTYQLRWKEGVVLSHIDLGHGAKWYEDRLVLDKAPTALGRRVQGKPVVDLFMHPFLSGRMLIESADGKKGERAVIRCEPQFLNFNAQTGMLWPVSPE